MSGSEFQATLQVIANLPGAEAVVCANAAWGAINGKGAKSACPKFQVHVGENSGVTVYGTYDLLAALNYKNGTTGLGLNAVCNALAGTSGLEAPAAMRAYAGLT